MKIPHVITGLYNAGAESALYNVLAGWNGGKKWFDSDFPA
jgi:hypothetical protein